MKSNYLKLLKVGFFTVALVVACLPSLVLAYEGCECDDVYVVEEKVEKEYQFSLMVGGISKHIKAEYDYNERNAMFGVRLNNWEVGVYDNSLNYNSYFIAYHKQWNLYEVENFAVEFGIRGGVVTYDGPVLFTAPTLSVVFYDTVSVEASYLPDFTEDFLGVLTLNGAIKF